MGFQKQHANPFSNDQQLLSLLGHPVDSSTGARARSGIPFSLHYHTRIDEDSILGYWSLKLDSLIPLCAAPLRSLVFPAGRRAQQQKIKRRGSFG